MVRVSSSELLEALGYDYYGFSEDASNPETVSLSFGDILPGLGGACGEFGRLAGQRLYRHQLEAYNALRKGSNLILISGTGSGKTEAWFSFSASSRARTMVVYPTLALANDQVRRLKAYSEALGLSCEALDAGRRDVLVSKLGSRQLRSYLSTVDILITNPAFLINDLKKWGRKGSYLYGFASGLRLFVIDEFDFYGPREVALLISMMRLMKLILGVQFQVSVLTATLGNPEEMSRVLTEITGLETRIVKGKPFRVANNCYVVLGKNLRRVWDLLRSHADRFKGFGRDVQASLENYEYFRKNVYKVLEAARAAGVPAPSLMVDPAEIIAHYVRDEGVTIVFTRSIRSAEEVYRKLRLIRPEAEELAATHHHLVDRERRSMIEKAAREGRMKVLVSPRTLSQGIDIGTVVRIVHIGLPEDVREYRQREGRKGRRKDIDYTETVIIPVSRWDRELLTRSVDLLRKWVSLPLEKTIVNPDNKYSTLFEGLFKLSHPKLKGLLTREEFSLLSELGLAGREGLTVKGKRAFTKMNFYEYALPYGIKRVKSEDGGRYLQDIGYCDLVERFQPGMIDYTADAIVTDLIRKGRVVTGVWEQPLRYETLNSIDFLAQALEEYYRVKDKWGEQANLFRDYYQGRLHSEGICIVDPPRGGFGLKTKRPNRVNWRLISEKLKPVVSDGKTYFLKVQRVIPVVGPTGGVYRDYTYGLTVEVDPSEDIEWLRVGLAYIIIVLRFKHGIPLDTFAYSVGSVGNLKLVSIHEEESAGLLEKIDWVELKRDVEGFKPDDMAEIMLQAVDEEAHLTLLTKGLRWDLAAAHASRIIDYILQTMKVKVKVKGREIVIPKISRALRLAAISVVSIPLSENYVIGGIEIYDGEEHVYSEASREYYLQEGWEEASVALHKLINQDFKLIVYDKASTRESLDKLGLKTLSLTVRAIEPIEIKQLASEKLGVEKPTYQAIAQALGLRQEVDLQALQIEFEKSKAILEQKGVEKWRTYTKYLRQKLQAYQKQQAENLMKAFLILSRLKP